MVKIEENNNKKYYITKGDNNSSNDEEKIVYENIEGVLVKKISKVGKVFVILQDTNIIIAIGLVFYLVYSFYSEREDRRIARHIKRKKSEN